MEPTYGAYLRVEELLRLQQPLSEPPEHDEQLFIIIHQVYELWFKLLIHEFDKARGDLSRGDLFAVIPTFKRGRTVMKTLVGQLDVLETMTPLSFLAFRDRLGRASGFQSAQFRELEFLLGYKRPQMIEHYAKGSPERIRLEKRLKESSLVDHFYHFLEHQGVDIPDRLKDKPPEQANQADATIQDELLALYRERADVSILLELMTDFDEGLQEWRYRHVKMVERTIGNKPGTGGSAGVDFLKATLFKPVFPDLWAIRHRM